MIVPNRECWFLAFPIIKAAQESANVFCSRPQNTYFRLCRSFGLQLHNSATATQKKPQTISKYMSVAVCE